jgi:hypothetical protein
MSPTVSEPLLPRIMSLGTNSSSLVSSVAATTSSIAAVDTAGMLNTSHLSDIKMRMCVELK